MLDGLAPQMKSKQPFDDVKDIKKQIPNQFMTPKVGGKW